MKRHPITQSDAQQQAAALVECEQFLRDCGIELTRDTLVKPYNCDHCGSACEFDTCWSWESTGESFAKLIERPLYCSPSCAIAAGKPQS